MARSEANLGVLERFVADAQVDRLPGRRQGDALQHLGLPRHRRAVVRGAAADKQAAAAKKMADLLEAEKAGYDLGSYRDAPPGLRIWCGATVEQADLEALLPWLDWAYAEIEREFGKAAA